MSKKDQGKKGMPEHGYSMYQVMKNINKAILNLPWLVLWNPTERVSKLDGPETQSLYLLNDDRAPIPRKLLLHDETPDSWDEAFQSEISDRLHEIISVEVAKAAKNIPYISTLLVQDGEWNTDVNNDRNGLIDFDVIQVVSAIESPLGSIAIDLTKVDGFAIWHPTRAQMMMGLHFEKRPTLPHPHLRASFGFDYAHAASPVKASEFCQGLTQGEKLSAPHGNKGIAMPMKGFESTETVDSNEDESVPELEVSLVNLKSYIKRILESYPTMEDMKKHSYWGITSDGQKLDASKIPSSSKAGELTDMELEMISNIWKIEIGMFFKMLGYPDVKIAIDWTQLVSGGNYYMLGFIQVDNKFISFWVKGKREHPINDFDIDIAWEGPEHAEEIKAQMFQLNLKSELLNHFAVHRIHPFWKSDEGATIKTYTDTELINILKDACKKLVSDTDYTVIVGSVLIKQSHKIPLVPTNKVLYGESHIVSAKNIMILSIVIDFIAWRVFVKKDVLNLVSQG